MKYSVIGMDIAKQVFQLHRVEVETGEVERIKLRRDDVLPYFARQAPAMVALEACGSAHWWARRLLTNPVFFRSRCFVFVDSIQAC